MIGITAITENNLKMDTNHTEAKIMLELKNLESLLDHYKPRDIVRSSKKKIPMGQGTTFVHTSFPKNEVKCKSYTSEEVYNFPWVRPCS